MAFTEEQKKKLAELSDEDKHELLSLLSPKKDDADILGAIQELRDRLDVIEKGKPSKKKSFLDELLGGAAKK